VRWAVTTRRTTGRLQGLDHAWNGPAQLLDAEERWAQARRLLHGDTLDLDDRVAGLLVLLYAQRGTTISQLTIADKLRALGLRPNPARSAALFGLAAELPAAILARMLGIAIDVAVDWQHLASGDWTSYAAEISRRPNATGSGDVRLPPRQAETAR